MTVEQIPADLKTGRQAGLNGQRLSWALSATAMVVWALVVIGAGLGGRVAGHWESAVTMLFGSFLAGSSPEGGGAVAFPVFTKWLEVPGPVARTFGLSIQAVGMTMAAISIILCRRPFHGRAVAIGSIAGVAGLVLGAGLFGRPDDLFWPPSIGSPWVKATFSIVLATTSIMMLNHLHHRDGDHPPTPWTRRLDIGLAIAAATGGVLASLTGTGVNILVFVFLVSMADVLPKTALPSAVMVMAAVSVSGLVGYGLVDGQLYVAVTDGVVTSVGGKAATLDAGRTDLLGLWLAAVPVVVWGAPLGSFVASLVREANLVRFVALLATIEVITTFLLVPELRTEPALMAYLVGGLAVVPAGLLLMRRHRRRIFA